MSVVGFKSKESLQGESTYLRFWMFLNDETNENGVLNKLYIFILINNNKRIIDFHDTLIKCNNEYFHVLSSSLRKENRVAVVWLQNNTYATIEAPNSESCMFILI